MLADLHEQAGSPKKAVKPLETAFRNMPHELLAMRLRTLWGVNEGTAAGRLMRLIPDDGALAAEGRRVVAAVALENGLVGEARRLIDEIDPAMRDAAAWRLVARLAAGNVGLVHEAPDGCAGFATLEWRRPDGRRKRCTARNDSVC